MSSSTSSRTRGQRPVQAPGERLAGPGVPGCREEALDAGGELAGLAERGVTLNAGIQDGARRRWATCCLSG